MSSWPPAHNLTKKEYMYIIVVNQQTFNNLLPPKYCLVWCLPIFMVWILPSQLFSIHQEDITELRLGKGCAQGPWPLCSQDKSAPQITARGPTSRSIPSKQSGHYQTHSLLHHLNSWILVFWIFHVCVQNCKTFYKLIHPISQLLGIFPGESLCGHFFL